MNTLDAIINRRTVHTFTDRLVPEEIVERALNAANHAPCHRLTFPWRFTLAGPMLRNELAGLAIHIKGESRPLQPEDIEKIRSKILTPSTLLVASRMQCPDPAIAREDYAACACAIQNLMISFSADGVGTKWSTGSITRHPETYRLLGADPTREELIGFIWAGYGDPPETVRRPVLDQVARRTP